MKHHAKQSEDIKSKVHHHMIKMYKYCILLKTGAAETPAVVVGVKSETGVVLVMSEIPGVLVVMITTCCCGDVRAKTCYGKCKQKCQASHISSSSS